MVLSARRIYHRDSILLQSHFYTPAKGGNGSKPIVAKSLNIELFNEVWTLEEPFKNSWE